ncbi:glycosyltransferase family 4 protein [Saccharicrinis sp. GN24d3]|uniref:glycosyltransferase family 4 protein n=1 Tax=Saccharicrinis sp. GN24d3 TaxID=3458416 RepID=UPI0040370AD5
MQKKKILIFIDWFLPGYKAGGPVRSMANMVEYLRDEYAFYIVTRNTDYTEIMPYKGIEPNQWTDFSEGVKVYYAAAENQNLSTFKNIISSTTFDVAYINGIYSWKFSIMPLIALRKFSGKKVVASRGMLAQSAIDVKGGKKKLFLKLVKLFNLYKGVTFHATNEKEKEDINGILGLGLKVQVADNLPKKTLPEEKSINKVGGELKLVSLARISPEKNTLFAIECLLELGKVEGRISFDLYGQVYNQQYWEECKSVIVKLPENIKVTHKGTVEADRVGDTIQNYHALFLPSRGENFGHVILESLMAGRPVLISDQTPWRGLTGRKAGWDISLVESRRSKVESQGNSWEGVLNLLKEMEQEEFEGWCEGARKRAERFIHDPGLVKSYDRLFNI